MDSQKDCDENQSKNTKIIKQLIGFSIKHRKIMQHYLDKTGVYQAQHHLLMTLARNQNASQKDLATSMDVSAATIAVTLKKLEKGGYIKKKMDKGDNRFNQITITKKGNEVVEKSKQIFDAVDQRIFEGITEEEKLTLSALLKKMDNNLSKMEEEIKSNK
ncbi:MAG: DNA-binding transcriptional regulator, MarR family [Lachnoclostridium sp.]